MTDKQADLLSPAFFGGLAGMAITNTSLGFLTGAVVVWLLFAVMLTVAAYATANRDKAPRIVEPTITGLTTQL